MKNYKILFLGDVNSPLLSWLMSVEKNVVQKSEKISREWLLEQNFSFLVSYGYRFILTEDILRLFPKAAVNLHISYLPWNKGAAPNLWSFVDNTPKGVSIHYIDQGIDTGDIIAQKEVNINIEHHTLASSYDLLQYEIQQLFILHWQSIKQKNCPSIKQQGQGSVHNMKDSIKLQSLLVSGWQTNLLDIVKMFNKTS